MPQQDMHQHCILSYEKRYTFDVQAEQFPFACELSLAPLITFWQQSIPDGHPMQAAMQAQTDAVFDQAPVLLEPIADLAALEPHQDLIDILMTMAFPRASWEEIYAAALVPFQLQTFYTSPRFQQMFTGDDGRMQGRINVDGQTVDHVKMLHAYAYILQHFYDIPLEFDYPLIFTAIDPDTGLDRHFRIDFDARFVTVKTLGPVPSLSEADKQHLLGHLADPHELMALLPPERFAFEGFAIINAVDVTDQEVISSLKRDLIEKESIISNDRFYGLQQRLQTLFRKPDLFFELGALQGDQVLALNCSRQIEYSCIYADSEHHCINEFEGSVYSRACRAGEVLVVDDLTTYPHRTNTEDKLMDKGLRSFVVAPLHYQDSLIGVLSIGSPRPGDLHALNIMKLRDVLPLFAVSIHRSLEEFNTRLQAIIKEQCTAIHPSVEWRFRQAALHWTEQRFSKGVSEMEPIVFDHVYPLYGVSDIRSSSRQRNAGIQADLLEHLQLAQDILCLGHGHKPLPILDHMAHHIGKWKSHIASDFGAGDELSVIDFMRRDVEPLFETLGQFNSEIAGKIDAYRAAIDPQLGTIYRRRRDFEESVMYINEVLSSYLDIEQEKAQAMFPHYFEKHKSDGVEYGIYIGASMVENGQFDLLYLHNLRLWQLMVMCGIVRLGEQTRSQLKVPLELAHLILLQQTPLSVRFRLDEKRFDIDGA
ncbi:GAF domain-containing protein, partial [Candidatus Entotheonella palauensis]|uniref:GAF domain-containing protein n=1 Tax=Candidatus Entotheonella palauensis TaxID=93172 RepID=UPI000B7FB813